MAHFECSSRSKDARLSGRFILRTRHFRVNVGKGNNFPLQPAESFPCGFDADAPSSLFFRIAQRVLGGTADFVQKLANFNFQMPTTLLTRFRMSLCTLVLLNSSNFARNALASSR